jgi:FAD-linked oxidoreductase
MKNWSGYIQWNPAEIVYPESEQAIQTAIQKAITKQQKVRLIGTGHSFTPICKTDELLMSLDRFQGIINIDKNLNQVEVKAGTKLSLLGDLIFEQGLAMENMGDVDEQSIAGTISTGTHGTGQSFGTISTQVVKIKFVNGYGELIECSSTYQVGLFKAAQVSLGMLGVITSITLQCQPAYKLKLQNRKEILSKLLPQLNERNNVNRNFEFYWFPYTDAVWTKTSNISEDPIQRLTFGNYFSEYVLENYAFKALCEFANTFPSKNKMVAKVSAASISNSDKTFYSHKVYATQRLVKFNEMEYNVPIAAHQEVLLTIKKVFDRKKFDIHFPIENRIVKADDIYLSPAYKRDAAYIACHAYYKKDPLPYFKVLEEIFRDFNGRPHWGKMHFLKTEDIERLYPELDTFLKYRKEHDPNEVFLNSYLKNLFSI